MGVIGVVVLAGGGATRMGGAPKPALVVAGTRLIDRVLAAATPLGRVVVVAPPDLELPPGILRTREDPPGAGPVAAFSAGLSALTSADPPPSPAPPASTPAIPTPPTAALSALAPNDRPPAAGVTAFVSAELPAAGIDGGGSAVAGSSLLAAAVTSAECVVLLGADLPVITMRDLTTLVEQLGDHDAAVFVDEDGRAQWMCSVWRYPALLTHLRALGFASGFAGAGSGAGKGPSIRGLARELSVKLVAGEVGLDGLPPWFDCDTGDDLQRAEEWLRR
jgi:molybdopterin-guanine dinucleotide biosynthesis protein A